MREKTKCTTRQKHIPPNEQLIICFVQSTRFINSTHLFPVSETMTGPGRLVVDDIYEGKDIPPILSCYVLDAENIPPSEGKRLFFFSETPRVQALDFFSETHHSLLLRYYVSGNRRVSPKLAGARKGERHLSDASLPSKRKKMKTLTPIQANVTFGFEGDSVPPIVTKDA